MFKNENFSLGFCNLENRKRGTNIGKVNKQFEGEKIHDFPPF